ncbi:hypothetical protein UJ50_002404 [Salmonella enterica subsp. enterica]|nr:hypothetical protein [Salmonella enterica subsp. enterica]
MKNALTIASEKLYKPSKKWKPADKPEMLLLVNRILLENLLNDLVSSVFSESQFEFSNFFTDTFLSLSGF